MSAPPTAYNRIYDFASYQTSSPNDPLPAAQLESELDAIEVTVDGLVSRLAEIQADDGNLRPYTTKGADLASASTLTLGTDGNYFDVTGTTAITAIDRGDSGPTFVILQFDSTLTLTHHATNLILPGAANITTAAGDHAIFQEYADDDWRLVAYQRMSAVGVNAADVLNDSGVSGATVSAALDTLDSGKAASSHTHAASDITSGTLADARVAESNVTQHQAAIDHDALTNFVAAEHIDWTGDAGASNIHVNNITSVPSGAVTAHQGLLTIGASQLSGTLDDARVAESNVTQHEAALSIAADQVDFAGAGAMPTTADSDLVLIEDVTDSTVKKASLLQLMAHTHSHAASEVVSGTFADARISETSVTQHEAAIDHDALTNFVAAEHIDWTGDAGASNIHVNNITAVPESAVTAHQAALSVTESQVSDLGSYLTASSSAALTNKTWNENFLPSTDLAANIGSSSKRWLNCWIEQDTFVEGAAPATPPANHVTLYAKTDGKLYIKDDAGTETDLTASGAALPVDDTTAVVQDPVDNTKLVRIDAGAITTGTTRVITMGDRDVNLASGGTFAENTHTHATSDITSGTFADARVAQSNVTQHQAALSITESQISDLGSYLTDVVSDTTPQLGGNLDGQTYSISTSGTVTSGGFLDVAWATGGVVVVDGGGELATHTNVDSTELGYLNGLSQNVANKFVDLDNADAARLPLDGSGTMTGALLVTEIAAPSTPATGKVAVYAKTDGKLYIKDDAGTETDLTASGAALPVDDTTAVVQDPVDNTKLVRIDAGAITTGTTRVITMGDRDVNLASGGTFAENTHTHATSDITSGTLADARVAESNVTQHQAALALAASQVTSGTLAHERGGLEADVSAYNGLVKVSGGATSSVTDNSTNWDTAYGWGDHSGQGYLTAVSGDATPQLGGDLDCNGNNIGIDGGNFINDQSGNAYLSFLPDIAAVNYLQVSNKATGGNPYLEAKGSDLNVGINFVPKGSGVVQAGGVEVATISGSQTLTNKTIDASQLTVTGNFDYGQYNVYANLFGATLDNTTYADLSSSEWEFYVGGSAVLHLDSVQDATFYGNIAGPTTQVSSHHILDHTTTPTAPGAGTSHLYAKSDGELYFYANGGSETQVTNQGGGGLADVVDDTTPELGGNLTLGTNWLVATGGYGVQDTSGNELATFLADLSAVNHLQISNKATGGDPFLEAKGDDTNVGINLVPKGSGTVKAGGVEVVTTSGSQTLTNKEFTNPDVTDQTLTDGATINWDADSGSVATVTLAGNRTMAAPTNLNVGTYILKVVQDATGSRTLTWNSVFKWPGGTAPTLTTTGSAVDIITFFCDGTNLYGGANLNFS